MFTVEERERVRERLLGLAEADPAVEAAAVTGSSAVGGADEWSDIDLAFATGGELPVALGRWTSCSAEFGPRGPSWRIVFGAAVELPPGAPVRRRDGQEPRNDRR
jgi:hypothetical protein